MVGTVPLTGGLLSEMSYFNFNLLKKSSDSNARAGLFETPHGVIETPIFMPSGQILP